MEVNMMPNNEINEACNSLSVNDIKSEINFNASDRTDSGCSIKNENESKQDTIEIRNIPDNNEMNAIISDILDHVKSSSAIFKNQQIGDPELTEEDKRSVAETLLHKNPSNFLLRFGKYLSEHHFDYFLSSENREIVEYANQLRLSNNESKKKLIQKNRRFEALKRLEAEGVYFSEAEMEKREPLLYHQLVGQFLNEKERLLRNRESKSNIIPTFSNFLIEKMERDEIIALRKLQEEEEKNLAEEISEDENSYEADGSINGPRWGDDWVDAENAQKRKSIKKGKKQKKINLSSKEKALLLDEFKSLMHSKFLNGLEPEFNYDEVDLNPEFDCLKLRAQDEEDKYFDEESCDNYVCTDTGIDDY